LVSEALEFYCLLLAAMVVAIAITAVVFFHVELVVLAGACELISPHQAGLIRLNIAIEPNKVFLPLSFDRFQQTSRTCCHCSCQSNSCFCLSSLSSSPPATDYSSAPSHPGKYSLCMPLQPHHSLLFGPTKSSLGWLLWLLRMPLTSGHQMRRVWPRNSRLLYN